jgi:hypothetical protein
MFDRVMGRCPECDRPVEFQSKAGPCILADYGVDAVPLAIAADLAAGHGHAIIQCDCGHYCKFVLGPGREQITTAICHVE